MSNKKKVSHLVLAGFSVLCLHIGSASALTIDPAFSGSYSFVDLGSVSGLPPLYGGMAFKAGDPDTLLIGGNANTAAGRFYEVPVIRDGLMNITGFGAPSVFGSVGDYNDGGIAYGPGGVLFTAQWPVNMLGQTKPGSTAEDKVTDLTPFGITGSSISGLNFVPTGFSGAGKFKVVTWSSGNWYDVALTPDGLGTYDISSATYKTTLSGGPEGFVFIDNAGNPGFGVDSLLIAEYSAGKIATYDLDANGDPILSSRRDFITGLTGAEGAVIDPITGDFLFSTFGGGDKIIRVDGFVPPPPPIPEPETYAMLLAGLGLLGLVARRRKQKETAA